MSKQPPNTLHNKPLAPAISGGVGVAPAQADDRGDRLKERMDAHTYEGDMEELARLYAKAGPLANRDDTSRLNPSQPNPNPCSASQHEKI